MANDKGLVTVMIDRPSPVYFGEQMVKALEDYRQLQADLDKAMPDQLMKIGDRGFRKKGFWRALARAFALSVEPITSPQEERSVVGTLADGSDNYVYTVTYKATAPNGQYATGDGTCAAAEKQTGRMSATEHNVRSHAHTRAFNRAVSNLVGFGEVSAEEVAREEHEARAATDRTPDGEGAGLVIDAASERMVRVIEVRRSTQQKKPSWVKLSDGREGSTFDAKLVDEAERLHKAHLPIVATFEMKEKNGRAFTNLIGIDAATAPTLPLQEDAEPVGTPEKVLTVRRVENAKTPAASYWEINTDKRVYVTRDEAVKTRCEAAMGTSTRFVIVFKPIRGASKVFNEIDVAAFAAFAEVAADGEIVGERAPEAVGTFE